MRIKALILLACGAVLTAAGPARAGGLVIPDVNSASAYRFYAARASEQQQLWTSSVPAPVLVQTPIASLIAAKLGLVEGSAELFRYQVEDAPSNKTVLDGAIDGGGIRFRLRW
jgi:hypothetical protein